MRWVNDHAVVQFSVKTPECVVKLRRQFVRITAKKIGPAGGADEERITSENAPGRVSVIFLRRHVTDVLRRMARCMTSSQDERTEGVCVAILDHFAIESVFGAPFAARINLCRPRARGQFARTADQIGMNVRLENVSDRDAAFCARAQDKPPRRGADR